MRRRKKLKNKVMISCTSKLKQLASQIISKIEVLRLRTSRNNMQDVELILLCLIHLE